MMRQAEQGALFDGAGVEEGLRAMWGLDKPWYVRYLRWLGNLLRGNLGYSLSWQAPVHEIIASRFVLSMTVALAATVLVWVIAFPIGIYSATRQYSLSDNAVTFVGFLGLSIPNFLLGADHDVSRQPFSERGRSAACSRRSTSPPSGAGASCSTSSGTCGCRSS